MNKVVYLENGQEADLIKKIGDEYLVAPYMVYYGYENEVYSEPTDSLRLVKKVYEKPPIEKVSEEYEKVLDEIKIKKSKLSKVIREFDKLTRTNHELSMKTMDLENLIFNRGEIKNAKRISYFTEKTIKHTDFVTNSRYNLKLSFDVEIMTGNTRVWAVRLSDSDYSSHSSADHIDNKYGILVDKTDEELEELTIKRGADYTASYFSEKAIEQCEDKYLTESLIKFKQELLEKSKLYNIKRLETDVRKAEEELRVMHTKLDNLNRDDN